VTSTIAFHTKTVNIIRQRTFILLNSATSTHWRIYHWATWAMPPSDCERNLVYCKKCNRREVYPVKTLLNISKQPMATIHTALDITGGLAPVSEQDRTTGHARSQIRIVPSLIYTLSIKMCTCYNNFDKCEPTSIILTVSHTVLNCSISGKKMRFLQICRLSIL